MLSRVRARGILAIIAVIGFILVTAGFMYVLFNGLPVKVPEGKIGDQIVGMLGMLVGTWNAAMMMVLTFHFGSSEGSKEKDQKLLSS